MKIYAKPFKTYEGARKRMQFEKAHAKAKTWVWGIKEMGEKRYHVVRWPRAEYQREMAISVALKALEITG